MEILSSVEWNKQLFLRVTLRGREPHALIDEDSFGESNSHQGMEGGDMLCIICISDNLD